VVGINDEGRQNWDAGKGQHAAAEGPGGDEGVQDVGHLGRPQEGHDCCEDEARLQSSSTRNR
jgi:hypothetical protein